MRVFDGQSHVFPREYAELLVRNKGALQVRRTAGEYTLTYGELAGFKLDPGRYDPERKLEDMNRNGVDMALLSVNIPGPELLDPELRMEATRLCNDYVADLVSKCPDRFAGLAVIPWQDPPAAEEEMHRAIGRLGLRGVVLYSHFGGNPVDDPTFQPLFSFIEKQSIPLVMHPTFPTWSGVIRDYSMVPMLGMMVDTSIAMLRLILSGTLERYPALNIVHPHCGGVLPYLMPRVVEQTEVKGRGRDNIRHSPDTYYKRVFLDLVSPSAQAMRYALEYSGVDQCLFGSDHPWVSISSILDCFRELDLSPVEVDKVLFQNACRLFSVDP